jgi:hypothetical protein
MFREKKTRVSPSHEKPICDNHEVIITIIAIWRLIQGSKDHPGATFEVHL